MKQREIQKCVFCDRGVMHSASPMFYQIEVDTMVIDVAAVQRQAGLEQFIGNVSIANIMGTDADLAKSISKVKCFVCMECALQQQVIAAIPEIAEKPEMMAPK